MREGWILENLGGVLSLLRNGINCKQNKKGIGDKISRIESISTAKFDTEKVGYATLEESTKKKYRLKRGDILFSHINSPIHVGKTALFNSDEDIYHGVNLLLMRPKKGIDSTYLEYFLQSLFQSGFWLKICKQSVNQASVNQRDINKIEIHYPESLNEQKRIVAILDEAFEAINRARANIEKNIQNAEELFQSKLNEVFEQRGEGWEEKTINDITDVKNGYAFKSKDFSPDNPIKAIKITNVGVQEFVEDTGNNLPRSFLDTYKKVKVSRGDIVIALTRTIISSGLKVARVPESYNGSLVNQRVAALSPIKEILNPTYLYYFLSTDIVFNYVLSNVNTLMQPNLSIRDLRKLKVPVCSLSKQKEITFLVDSLWEKINNIIDAYETKLNNLSELKNSLLQKAFSGELTVEEAVIA